MGEERKNIISYHTFVFPFLWDDGGKVTRKGFEKKLIEGTNWKKDILDPDAVPDSRTYAQQQYFNHAARNAMFVRKDDAQAAVHNFTYDFGKHLGDEAWLASDKNYTNPVRLLLEKGDFSADLSVRGVRLKLYNTGVGLLLFELSNYALSGEKNLNRINEYGRRLFMPYVDFEGNCGDCADTMTLRIGRETVESRISGRKRAALDDVLLPELIKFFLKKGEYTVTADRKREKKELFIEPIIDDRMFTLCYYVDGAFVADMARWDEECGCYAYLADAQKQSPSCKESLARRMYEVMFVDGNGLTCHSRPMLAELLEKNLYTRWLGYTFDDGTCAGTVTGITEYSMVTVSTSPFVAETAFLPEYVEMACLVLAQRASLLAFEKRISESAKGKAAISKIQRSYVIFQGQLLLREVTPQQQGIELYDLMLEQLMIQKEAQEIEAQLNAMFALEQTIQQQQESLLLGILAFISVFDGIRFFATEHNGLWTRLISAGVVIVMLLLYLLVRKRRIK